MTWLLISIIAYFLNAVANVIDKTMLKKNVLEPIVYAFYIAVLGSFLMLVFIPFGVNVPSLVVILLALAGGIAFMFALLLMFVALQKNDATQVAPMIGGLVPIFVLILAAYFLKESLTVQQYIAFVFLLSGSFLISLDFRKHGAWHWLKKKLRLEKRYAMPKIRKVIWVALPSAILFGMSHTLSKYVYSQTEFLTGFVWTRLGSLLAIVLLILIPKNWQAIKQNLKKSSSKKNQKQTKKTGFRFLVGQACGGAAMLLLQYAIFLGSVTLVNALLGLQYAFVFLIVLMTTLFFPKFLKEKFTKELFWQKVIAVILIFIGLYFIAI